MDDYRRKMTYLPLFDASELKAGTKRAARCGYFGFARQRDEGNFGKGGKNFNIQYVAPHPRQTYGLSGVTALNSPYVIEDYILREIKKTRIRGMKFIPFQRCGVDDEGFSQCARLRIETGFPSGRLLAQARLCAVPSYRHSDFGI